MNDVFIGKHFNMVTVLRINEDIPHGCHKEINYVCKCDCGKEFNCKKSEIKYETKYSCGCRNRLKYELAGKRFGKLVVIKSLGLNKHKEMKWLCKCDCGKESAVTSYCLRNGSTKSCGCLKNFKNMNKNVNKPHYKKIHNCYVNMETRCFNKKSKSYDRYGERGITICEEWNKNFSAFYDWCMENGFEENLTLDRIDNDKGYEPQNCRWTTNKVQSNNRSSNLLIEHGGVTKTLSQWSDFLGVKYGEIQHIYYKTGSIKSFFDGGEL